MTSGIKRTRKEVLDIVNKLGYVFIDEYQKNNLRRVIFKDRVGYKYEVTINNIMSKIVPEIFRRTNPFTLENISLWLITNNKNFELTNKNKYVNNSAKLSFYCYRCKEVFYAGWNQILSGSGCGICAGSQIGRYNNLKYARPDLAKEWSSKNTVSPENFTASSGVKIWWKCSVCSYEWKTRIADRNAGRGCSACAGQVLTDKNRLSITHPKVSSEWHSTKNKGLTPKDVSYGTNRKVWWLCTTCQQEWFASINSRTNIKSGCPYCANAQKESKIALTLKKLLKNEHVVMAEYKILKNPETGAWLPYDIYLSDKNVYIEIHGEQHYKLNGWHKLKAKENKTVPEEEFNYQKHKDKLKKRFARKNGIYVEIDIRKIKNTDAAMEFIKNKI